jgi:hypothetical protein
MRTTQSTLEDRKQAVPFEALPNTFRDAVIVTRQLGLTYLWIDSLCIIQDSASDWAIESAKMSSTYTKAYVTIAADGAADSSTGFLTKDRSREAMQIDWASMKGEVSPIYVRHFGYNYESYVVHRRDPEQRSKLSTRAWVFQERLLSPRTLYYGISEFGWECKTEVRCECSIEARNNEEVMKWDSPRAHDSNLTQTIWYELVASYTKRLLSFDTDRLPAISGLASAIRRPPGDEYLCGIWKLDLPLCLLWNAFPSGSKDGQLTSRRHREYYSPSWSWASITGAIDFDDSFYNRLNAKYDFQILETTCVPAGGNPFGPASGGFINALAQ